MSSHRNSKNCGQWTHPIHLHTMSLLCSSARTYFYFLITLITILRSIQSTHPRTITCKQDHRHNQQINNERTYITTMYPHSWYYSRKKHSISQYQLILNNTDVQSWLEILQTISNYNSHLQESHKIWPHEPSENRYTALSHGRVNSLQQKTLQLTTYLLKINCIYIWRWCRDLLWLSVIMDKQLRIMIVWSIQRIHAKTFKVIKSLSTQPCYRDRNFSITVQQH